ncbi:MAG: RNA-protein complex protein Nop10 [Archaeoglobaceae archaeon]|nr:RNA-protein complex protein Nop10 [Archaeoglobaceae archaeon]MDW7989388.1 RNA-protein complex protein Nop10 [Archaeoglobaceae archaeon]
MKSLIRKCPKCQEYTLGEICQRCKEKTLTSIPPKFSPEDPYGKYRRMLRKEKSFFLRRW